MCTEAHFKKVIKSVLMEKSKDLGKQATFPFGSW